MAPEPTTATNTSRQLARALVGQRTPTITRQTNYLGDQQVRRAEAQQEDATQQVRDAHMDVQEANQRLQEAMAQEQQAGQLVRAARAEQRQALRDSQAQGRGTIVSVLV